MEMGGLGWLPFDCCVFITYTREIKRHIFEGAFMAGLARVCFPSRVCRNCPGHTMQYLCFVLRYVKL